MCLRLWQYQGINSKFVLWPCQSGDQTCSACTGSSECQPLDHWGSPPDWRVAISFSNAWKWKVKVKSLSRVWLSATPWTAAHQAPPSMGLSRQEYWSGVPLPSPDCLNYCSYKGSLKIRYWDSSNFIHVSLNCLKYYIYFHSQYQFWSWLFFQGARVF